MNEPCEHKWEFRSDWGGDDTIPNGTFDASFYYCPLCDTEQTEQPDDYEEYFEEPDIDYSVGADSDYENDTSKRGT